MEKSHTFVGKKTPAFCLPNERGEQVCLRDLIGRKKMIVLYFYPKDMTSGCAVEAREFTQLKKSFDTHKAEIYGISKDDQKRHQKFIEKESLLISLLSDESCKTLVKYNVWKEKSMYGRKYMGIMRETFLIDAMGTVVKHWQNVKPAGHAKEVLEVIKQLK